MFKNTYTDPHLISIGSPKKYSRVDSDLLLNKKLIAEKSPLIESRYPKLIYAFKKFFKSLKKLAISNTETSNELTKVDLYALKERHNLIELERILREVNFKMEIIILVFTRIFKPKRWT